MSQSPSVKVHFHDRLCLNELKESQCWILPFIKLDRNPFQMNNNVGCVNKELFANKYVDVAFCCTVYLYWLLRDQKRVIADLSCTVEKC